METFIVRTFTQGEMDSRGLVDLNPAGDVRIDVDPEERFHAHLGSTRRTHDSMVQEALERAQMDAGLGLGDVLTITTNGRDAAWVITEQGFVSLTVAFGPATFVVR